MNTKRKRNHQSKKKVVKRQLENLERIGAWITWSRASFEDRKVESIILTDEGSHANILQTIVLDTIQNTQQQLRVSPFKLAILYRDISGRICLTCKRQVVLDIYLKLRHGCTFILRKNQIGYPKRVSRLTNNSETSSRINRL